jgi:hypothetical protein
MTSRPVRRIVQSAVWFGVISLIRLPLLFACATSKKVTDTRGRTFIKVRSGTPGTPANPGQAELWQEVGKVGPDKPVFLRLLGEPPTFT